MKWLVKAAFLASAMMIIPTTLSAQNPLPDYIVGIAKEQGVQVQKISTLEETARETKKEIHELKEEVNKQFGEVNKRFDEVKQLIANSAAEANARFANMTAETNARFEKYFNQTDTRLKALEQPWSTEAFVNVYTNPLMFATAAFAIGGTLLAQGGYKQLSYLTLGISTGCLAQVLWEAVVVPTKYAVVSAVSFVSMAGAGIYGLNEYHDKAWKAATAVSGVSGFVSVFGVVYKLFDTAEKKKSDL